MATSWRLKREAHESADPKLSAPVSVFAAPGLGQTFQLTGTLRLTADEFREMKEKLGLQTAAPAAPDPDLSPEEYNRLQTFLMEWAEQDTEALYLAEIVRSKFGASARRRREQG